MRPSPDAAICSNCGAALSGPYCASCGQQALPRDPTLHDLFHDLTHEMLHVDGRIFRSIRKLLLEPGFLTLEQREGRRARWIAPLRLYLVFSVLYFAVASVAGGGARVDVTGTDEETGRELQRLGFENEQRLQETIRHAQTKWTPRVMFVLVPLFAVLVHAAYRRSGGHYPQHLYFALHVHAAWFAAGAVAAAALLAVPRVAGSIVQVAAVLYGLVYLVLALRRVYGGRIGGTVWRAASVIAVYWVAVVGAVVAIVLPAVLRHR